MNVAPASSGGVSSSADSFAFGGHVGTHIDALCHFSCGGTLYGGVEVGAVQNDSTGFSRLSVDTIAPIVRRGVLLDIAAYRKVDALPTDFAITPEHLDSALLAAQISIDPGDVVLLRTGWAQYFSNFAKFVTGGQGNAAAGPGPPGRGVHPDRAITATSSRSETSDAPVAADVSVVFVVIVTDVKTAASTPAQTHRDPTVIAQDAVRAAWITASVRSGSPRSKTFRRRRGRRRRERAAPTAGALWTTRGSRWSPRSRRPPLRRRDRRAR